VKYHEIFPMTRRELEALIDCGNETAIVDALLSAAYYDPDWRWVQGVCLKFLDQLMFGVRRIAAICFGHIARIHKTLDLDLVLPKLELLKGDPAIGPDVENALEDIPLFLGLQSVSLDVVSGV
jgi:hypothetical protein